MKLFSFAYAGGDGHVFYPMKDSLAELGITVSPYMYRGRNNRQAEGHYQSIDEAGAEAASFIQDSCQDGQEYMLLGHSMGSLVAYECYQRLAKSGSRLPERMIFSGVLPPDRLVQKKYDVDNDQRLIEQLAGLGGMSTDVLNIPEFREFFLPIIKNDVRIFDRYQMKQYPKIKVPVTVLTGASDAVSGEKVLGWKNHTEAAPMFIELEGDHFFLFKDSISYGDLFQKICS